MSILLESKTLSGGALLEALDYAIEEALANVLDPNTDAKKPRKITATIKPDSHRNMGALSFEVKTGLCAPVPVETSIIIERDKKTGKAVASEMYHGEDPNQLRLLKDHDVEVELSDGKTISFPVRATN